MQLCFNRNKQFKSQETIILFDFFFLVRPQLKDWVNFKKDSDKLFRKGNKNDQGLETKSYEEKWKEIGIFSTRKTDVNLTALFKYLKGCYEKLSIVPEFRT